VVSWRIDRFRAIESERSETIMRVADEQSLSAAAFDGPLRRGLDLIGRYRAAERLLTRRLAPMIGKPGQSSTPVGKLLNAHANACASIVADGLDVAAARHAQAIHDLALVEAFPGSFMGSMIVDPESLRARRSDRSDIFFKHLVHAGTFDRLIEALLPGRSHASPLLQIINHDDRAALVCALTALCVAAGRYTAVGDDADGWIILPPADFIERAAMAALEANATGLDSACLVRISHDDREAP
jgi:predicted nuclease with RNAse H fold